MTKRSTNQPAVKLLVMPFVLLSVAAVVATLIAVAVAPDIAITWIPLVVYVGFLLYHVFVRKKNTFRVLAAVSALLLSVTLLSGVLVAVSDSGSCLHNWDNPCTSATRFDETAYSVFFVGVTLSNIWIAAVLMFFIGMGCVMFVQRFWSSEAPAPKKPKRKSRKKRA